MRETREPQPPCLQSDCHNFHTTTRITGSRLARAWLPVALWTSGTDSISGTRTLPLQWRLGRFDATPEPVGYRLHGRLSTSEELGEFVVVQHTVLAVADPDLQERGVDATYTVEHG